MTEDRLKEIKRLNANEDAEWGHLDSTRVINELIAAYEEMEQENRRLLPVTRGPKSQLLEGSDPQLEYRANTSLEDRVATLEDFGPLITEITHRLIAVENRVDMPAATTPDAVIGAHDTRICYLEEELRELRSLMQKLQRVVRF